MHETVKRIIERASVDAEFRARLREDPAAALAGYPLSAADLAALTGDTNSQPPLAIDGRPTKTDPAQQEAILDWVRQLLP
jgi:hypothetical protein